MIGHAPHRVYQLPISLQRVFGREFSERDLLTSLSSLRLRPSEIRRSWGPSVATFPTDSSPNTRKQHATKRIAMHRVTRVPRTATKEHRRRRRSADRELGFCSQNCLLRRDTSAKPMTQHPLDLFAIVGYERGRARKQRFRVAGRYVSAEIRAFAGSWRRKILAYTRSSRCFLSSLKGPQRRGKRFEREEKTDRRTIVVES